MEVDNPTAGLVGSRQSVQGFTVAGDYAVVLVNGSETLLKTITYLPDKKAYLLHAENPDYDDRIERNVQIQGVATMVFKKLQ